MPLRRDIERLLDGIDGFQRGGAVFATDPDAPAWWCNGTEVAHFDGDLVDVRLTRKVISQLRAQLRDEPRVQRRRPSSDWVEVRIDDRADLPLLRELAEHAATAHAPPPGIPPKPPPTGADLDRRRRWH